MKTEEDLYEHGSLDYVAGLLDGLLLARNAIESAGLGGGSRKLLENQISDGLQYLEEKITKQKLAMLKLLIDRKSVV